MGRPASSAGDVEHHGHTVPAGSIIPCFHQRLANHDERHFPDGDSFDIHCQIDHHLRLRLRHPLCLGGAGPPRGAGGARRGAQRWPGSGRSTGTAPQALTSTVRGWESSPSARRNPKLVLAPDFGVEHRDQVPVRAGPGADRRQWRRSGRHGVSTFMIWAGLPPPMIALTSSSGRPREVVDVRARLGQALGVRVVRPKHRWSAPRRPAELGDVVLVERADPVLRLNCSTGSPSNSWGIFGKGVTELLEARHPLAPFSTSTRRRSGWQASTPWQVKPGHRVLDGPVVGGHVAERVRLERQHLRRARSSRLVAE